MSITAANSSDLFPIAEKLLTAMMLALGAPGIVAAIETLDRALRRHILSWLAPMECLMRKLLLVEAAKLPRPGQTRPAPRTLEHRLRQSLAQRQRKARIKPVDPARPSTWRAPFRVPIPPCPSLPRKVRSEHPARITLLGAPVTMAELWAEQAQARGETLRIERAAARRANALKRLAIRYEALRRVIDDPRAAIERLAARLNRMRGGEPRRAARRLAQAGVPRATRSMPPTLFEAATAQALEAAEAFRDSS